MAYRIAYKHSALSSTQSIVNALPVQYMCHIVNNRLTFKYIDKNKYKHYFHQIKGLAISIPCPPKLANLYMTKQEVKSNIVSNVNIAYYGYYNHDIFIIVFAMSIQKALSVT